MAISPVLAQTPAQTDLKPALEYRFSTEAGKVYVVEGSGDGQTWVGLTPPIFGDGSLAKAFLTADRADGQRRYAQYRAAEVSPELFGPAPLDVQGRTLMLNDQGKPREVVLFRDGVEGRQGFVKIDADHARRFTWKSLRTAQDRMRLELTYLDGTTSTLSLRFFDGTLGSYEMRDFDAAGLVQGVDAGGFGLHPNRLSGSADASLPNALSGTSLLVSEGGRSTRMEFLSPDEVVLHFDDGSQSTRDYDYDVNSPATGTLRVISATGGASVYQLSLTAGSSGTYKKLLEPPPGQVPNPGNVPQSGAFDLPPRPVAPPNGGNCPPPSLDGRSLILNSSDPVTLIFQSDGTGKLLRERAGVMDLIPFLYDYSPTSSSGASLAIVFPGASSDKIEDYELEFNPDCSGTFQANSFHNGEPSSVFSGGFSTGSGVRGKQ